MKLQTQAQSEAQNTPSLQAVLFDVDGTLADTELEGHRVAFNQAFKEFALDWHWSPELYGELVAAVAGGKERILFYAKTRHPELFNRSDLDTWLAALHERKSAIYSEIVMSGAIPLRPGVSRLFDELRESGIRIAVATTTAPSSLNSLIKANLELDISSLFDVVGAGDQVANKKPSPDIYQWTLQQLNLPPENCLAIEDSHIGLTAARAAGLATVITVSKYTGEDNFQGALSVVSDLGEPDQPALHLDGLPLAGKCVDLAQLLEWHRQHTTPLLKSTTHPG